MYAQQYVDNDLLDKSPVELIRLLYSKAIDKLRQAAQHTRAGDIRGRSACLARVMEIVAALQDALDAEAGGVLAADLARLYDYMQRRLIEAATDSAAAQQLEEVRVLLGNLYEGWSGCEPPRPDPKRNGSEARESARATEETEAPGYSEATGYGEAPRYSEAPAGELPAPAAPAGYSGSEGRVWTL
jgi:flagellar protein FliS